MLEFWSGEEQKLEDRFSKDVFLWRLDREEFQMQQELDPEVSGVEAWMNKEPEIKWCKKTWSRTLVFLDEMEEELREFRRELEEDEDRPVEDKRFHEDSGIFGWATLKNLEARFRLQYCNGFPDIVLDQAPAVGEN